MSRLHKRATCLTPQTLIDDQLSNLALCNNNFAEGNKPESDRGGCAMDKAQEARKRWLNCTCTQGGKGWTLLDRGSDRLGSNHIAPLRLGL